MITRRVYHVVYESLVARLPWATKREGRSKASMRHRTQAAAIRYARSLAKSRRHVGQVIVHRRNGTILCEWTYGADSKRKG